MRMTRRELLRLAIASVAAAVVAKLPRQKKAFRLEDLIESGPIKMTLVNSDEDVAAYLQQKAIVDREVGFVGNYFRASDVHVNQCLTDVSISWSVDEKDTIFVASHVLPKPNSNWFRFWRAHGAA